MPEGEDVLVDVQGLKVHFPIKKGIVFDRTVGYVYAVDGMDMQIHRGETYSIEGPPLADKKSGLEYLTLLVSKGVKDG